MSKNDKLEVTIKYNNLKETISGSAENVTREYFKVLSKVIPAFDIALELTTGPSLTDMASKLKGLVYLHEDRVIILKKTQNVEYSVLLALTAKYISHGLKIASKETMTIQEITESVGRTKKAVLRILEKLQNRGAVDQIDDSYRISDWKAYEFVLKNLPESRPIKITDFVKEQQQTANSVSAFTIGYEGCSPDQFIKLLLSEQIEILVDVRKDAYSKADISYSEGTLCRILTEAKMKYIHIPELGVDYNLRQELKSNHDYATYFKRYSEYLEKNPDLVSFLADLSRNNRICLMCYEKDFRRCHRSVLAEKLEETGLMFHHLR
jgi:uncharacterized protein (DUF488 family)